MMVVAWFKTHMGVKIRLTNNGAYLDVAKARYMIMSIDSAFEKVIRTKSFLKVLFLQALANLKIGLSTKTVDAELPSLPTFIYGKC